MAVKIDEVRPPRLTGATRAVGFGVLFVACGCAESPPPARSKAAPAQPVKVESLVRAVVAEQFGVQTSEIAMDRPLSDPPLRADELDLVELVMELEERLDITIPDEVLEQRARAAHRSAATQITPADLVQIARGARAGSRKRAR